ncbi:MAG: YceI family protein, partial [Anaerolineae bacterium]|nr:YceI family protein [Anaerolineae bacterium]
RNLYRISSEDSQVSFTLQEDLRGNRIDVVGTTNEVAGDIVIDMANPAASQIGTIRINARTLETDNGNRNRAIRARILQSAQDEYEFIEFVPTAVDGLPESIEMGETYTFDVTGDLTIAGVTNETTFTVEATLQSADQLTGTASAVVLWSDWNISIPSAPGVANISEDVTLVIDFVADVVNE